MFQERIVMSKDKYMTEQLIETSIMPVINENSNTNSQQLEDVEVKNDPNNIDCMINFLEKYAEKVKSKNDTFIKEMSAKLEKTYDPVKRREFENSIWQKWSESGQFPPEMNFWNLHNMFDYSSTIYYDVAAIFLED